MILYVVKSGDSIYSIANNYKVSAEKIINENNIKDPNSLVVGQCLIIKKNDYVYYVKEGDSLYSIANKYGLSLEALKFLNPNITPPYQLTVGEKIRISTKKDDRTPIKINGYAYDSSSISIVEKSLPYLTYLSIFSYSIDENGSLIDINDTPLIAAAKKYNVAPIMVVTNTNKNGTFSTELVHNILNNEIIQNRLLKEIVTKLKDKEYYGLNIDFEYISPDDKKAYEEFIATLHDRLKMEGNYTLSVALAPKTSAEQTGLLYEAHDYKVLGEETDYTVLMTYEWGYTYGPAMPVAPINEVKKVIDYAITEMPPKKIFMGVPNYGYDFTLPYVEGSAAKSIPNSTSIEYAKSKNATIKYDDLAETPFFTYYDSGKKEHIVYFEDPRSIQAKSLLAKENNLGGISIWTISSYFKQLYEVLDNYFKIEKIGY